MKIKIKKTGEKVELTKNTSLSGKTTTYCGGLTLKSYTALTGYPTVKKNYFPGISIYDNGMVYITTGSPYGGTKGRITKISKEEIEIL
jgi:hypothetical protein